MDNERNAWQEFCNSNGELKSAGQTKKETKKEKEVVYLAIDRALEEIRDDVRKVLEGLEDPFEILKGKEKPDSIDHQYGIKASLLAMVCLILSDTTGNITLMLRSINLDSLRKKD